MSTHRAWRGLAALAPRWRTPLLAGVLALALAALIAGLDSGASRAASAPVNVFPVPGGRVASPATQITFRGLPAARLGAIGVVGSKSGLHAGRMQADSDNDGASFLPTVPFTAGETVTVYTSLDLVGGSQGRYHFTIANPAGAIRTGPGKRAARVRDDVARFASRRDLAPATITVNHLPRHAARGDLFVATQSGPVQNGPEIFGPYGGLVWFQRVPKGQSATDFRTQTFNGHSVLTWWQGSVSAAGTGRGADEIYSSAYRPVATVRAANGLDADLHEFEITPKGTALITAYYPVHWTTGSGKSARQRIVLDSVVQEIDIRTGLVLYQWDSLDHVSTADSHQPFPTTKGHPWDYFHINSIQALGDGSLLVSGRDTWAAYDLDRTTGGVIWSLGGKHSSFHMGANTTFAFQHDVRLRSGNAITLFDDGAGPPPVRHQSRGLTLGIDFKHRRVSVKAQDEHRPGLLAFYEGNVQQLRGGDQLVGWGQQPYLTEFNRHGQTVFDAHFVGANSSYRAYRFRWRAQPATPPAAAARTRHGHTTVYATWNGATVVARWRVLGGSSRQHLRAVASHPRTEFETAIGLSRSQAYVAVQALDTRGRVLATSPSVKGR
ncbi:MAG: hypothetical protein QOF83_3521 [Solirubrobacteraceae bacterium]|nr:hypothetical protein [Solirubrobacteraceae bacterium]